MKKTLLADVLGAVFVAGGSLAVSAQTKSGKVTLPKPSRQGADHEVTAQ